MLAALANLQIRAKLALVGLFFVLAAALTGWMAAGTLRTVQVGGPLYETIVRSKDLLADVLPPPEYIVESNLLANQMLSAKDLAAVEKLASRAQQLHRELEDRHGYWEKNLPPGKNKELLTVAAYSPAVRFYQQLEGSFLPALRKGEREQAAALLTGPMAQDYEEHRQAIDQVVQLSTAEASASEADVARVVSASAWRLLGTGVAAVVVIMVLLQLVSRMIASPMRRAVTALQQIAGGDLTVRLEVTSRDEAGQVAAALNEAVTRMAETVGRARDVAAAVAMAAAELSSAAGDIATGAQEQAASLEESAASLEELGGAVKVSADSAQHARELAGESRSAAENGGRVVSSAVRAMAEINVASRRIGDIVATIDEIAFQTNLLALNAAVEAARAGDQGRGFAVVAAEVRALSIRSALASKEVKSLVLDSLAKIESGSNEIQQSGRALDDIVRSAERVTEVIGAIAVSSREQDSGIGQINRAMSQLDGATQQGAAQTEELSATAEELAAHAAELQQIVARFHIDGPRSKAAPGPAAAPKPAQHEAARALVAVATAAGH